MYLLKVEKFRYGEMGINVVASVNTGKPKP